MGDELIELLVDAEGAEGMREVLNNIAHDLLGRVGNIITADELGFDYRAARTIFRGPTWLAVPKDENHTLRYYGGFEYVDDDCITELGDYVFYFTDCPRVLDHWAQAAEESEASDD